MHVKPLSTPICCIVLLAALVGCRSSHDTEAFYAARADAAKSGEFDRGWLPDFLPKSSHAIHLAYDLSPSRVWCAFEFDAVETDTLLNSVKPANSGSPPITRIPNPHVKWWPKPLEGDFDVQKIQGAGLVLYSVSRPVSQVENETLLFAIDRTKGRGYFYGH